MIKLHVAKEFTRVPGSRYRSQGEGSGEQFREEHLRPAFLRALKAGEQLLVQLDGIRYGYPTSFLDEAFGGLAREFGAKLVLETLCIEAATEPLLDFEIRRYVERTESTVASPEPTEAAAGRSTGRDAGLLPAMVVGGLIGAFIMSLVRTPNPPTATEKPTH